MWLWAALIALGGVAISLYQEPAGVRRAGGLVVVTVVLTFVVPSASTVPPGRTTSTPTTTGLRRQRPLTVPSSKSPARLC